MKIIIKIKNLFKRNTEMVTVEAGKKDPVVKCIRAMFWNRVIRNVAVVGVMMSNLGGDLKILSIIGIWIVSTAHLEVTKTEYRNQTNNTYVF